MASVAVRGAMTTWGLLALLLLLSSLCRTSDDATLVMVGLQRRLLESEPPQDKFSMTWRTGLMLGISFFVSALSMPAGIGGGIIFVPLNMLLLQLSPRLAASQSQAFILGGALGSAWVSLARRHPEDESRPLIDFDMLLLLLPLMLVGVAAGVILNDLFANWLITLLLFTVLVWQTYASAMKYFALRRKEKAAARQLEQQHAQQAQQPNGQQQQPWLQKVQQAGQRDDGEQQPSPSPFREAKFTPFRTSTLEPKPILPTRSLPASPAPGLVRQQGSIQLPRSQSLSVRLRASLEHSLELASRSYAEIPTPLSFEVEESAYSFASSRAASMSAGFTAAADRSYRLGSQHSLDSIVCLGSPSRERAGQGGEMPQGLHNIAAVLATAEVGWAAVDATGTNGLATIPDGGDSPGKGHVATGQESADRSLQVPAKGVTSFIPAAGAGAAAFTRPPPTAAELPIQESGAAAAQCTKASQPPASPGFWVGLWANFSKEVLRLPSFSRATLHRLAAVAVIWVCFVGFQVAKGVLSQSHGTKCFVTYWVLAAVEIALLLAVAAGYLAYLMLRHSRQQAQQAQQAVPTDGQPLQLACQAVEGHVNGSSSHVNGSKAVWAVTNGLGAKALGPAKAVAVKYEVVVGSHAGWSVRKVLTVQAVALVGGTLATTLGLGGGLVMSPLLLALDLNPLAGSATSSFMVLLTVGSATITYAVQDQLDLEYSLIIGASCLVGAFLGVAVVNYIVRRSGATSLVVLLMAGVVAAGAIICAAYSVPDAVDDIRREGAGEGFTKFCSGG